MIADRGLKQLHVAETEKYPHVTYFFNGGEEHEHEGETFKLVPSPRDVPTYDHKPQMSAYEATDAFVERFEAERGRCITHCYEVTYDGDMTHQPEEVMSGEWVSVDDLRARLDQDEFPDDGRLFLEKWLAEFA